MTWWTWLISKAGGRALLFVGGILLGLTIVMLVSQCSRPKAGDVAKQANRSAAAYGEAVGNAVNTIDNRYVIESDMNEAVKQVKGEIGDAKSPSAIRNAILDSLCKKPAHRDDPACAVQPSNPG